MPTRTSKTRTPRAHLHPGTGTPKAAPKKAPAASKTKSAPAAKATKAPARTGSKPKRPATGSTKTRTAKTTPAGKLAAGSVRPKSRISRAPKPKGLEASYSGRIFRSRLEARWAILMDLLEINWDYEPCHYQVGPELYYLPDFYLPEQQLWLEVKGAAFLDAGSMAKCLASVAGPMPLPLREAPYTPATNLLLAGSLRRPGLGRQVHTLFARAGAGRASLSYATFGREGATAIGGPWDEVPAEGIKKARRPTAPRIKALLDPPPAAVSTDTATAQAYRFAATASFDDGTGKLAASNDYPLTAQLQRRRAGRPLGLVA